MGLDFCEVTSAPPAVGFTNGVFFFKHRADGHEGSAALQFLLQHQRLPHPPDGPGSGPAVPGQPGVPGGSGHAQRQQGAAHSVYQLAFS